ncbi:hypothetical protein BBK36DRAFT_1119005 [Trichoderma citrinoviride]|uniref:WSC domain-containing protein n=1 Tax=Trichoderma citrinoviride TaxID=58853 RepID=A0A2T4BAB2_9HYPO|nr:hypothetical protein BBK36DRAFT_1119005 [Trichoderma citrinoviride]PTB66272.1 hypothetical protein BBK36DRAFT_1119005 [Trichoderma citrinoviride]
MKRLLVLAIIGVTGVVCQSAHNTADFSYQGCSSIDLACFGEPIAFSDSPVAPETCQAACRGHQFAAVLPDCCRCGDDPNGVHPADEAKCDYPCLGDSTRGMCGSICPENSPVIANVYTRVTPSQGQTYGDPANVQSSVAAAETPCPSAGASSVEESSQSPQRVTPAGPAPEAPTSFGNPVTGNSAATDMPTTEDPNTQGAQGPPCTTQGNPGVSTPSQGPLTPPGNAPEPKTFSAPNQQSPSTTPSSNAPSYSSNCQSSQPGSYSDENGPGTPGGSPGGDTSVDNCDPPGGPSLSPVVSQTTLWPWPSKKPEGDPPAPSHVPASNSPCGVVPPLSSIGGFILLAAMIM